MFSEDNTNFSQVPHIKQNEKAFSTEGNTDKSPGKQFQSLVNRDAFLQNEIQQLNTQSQSFDSEIKRLAEEVQKLANNSGDSTSSIADLIAEILGISEPRNKTVYDLISPLTQLLDADGKLPLNQLLATDNLGNITLIPRPKVSLTRIAIANIKSNFTGKAPLVNEWALRDINSVVRTQPAGVQEDWIENNGYFLIFNSPGQYLLQASGLSAMTETHQIRWKRYSLIEGGDPSGFKDFTPVDDDESVGLLIDTPGFGINGGVLTTDSMATFAFTLGLANSPEFPVYFALEHKIEKTFGNTRVRTDYGVPKSGWDSVFMVGSVIHIAIDTIDITDPRTIITDFNT